MITAPSVIAKATMSRVACLMAMTLGLLAGCATKPSAENLATIERARFAAMTQQDMPTLEKLLAVDLLYCHSNGVCEDKARFLETIESGRVRYKEVRLEQLAGRAVGKDVQIINGVLLLDGEQAGQSMTLRLVFTDVYVKRDGRWQLTAWQSTRVP